MVNAVHTSVIRISAEKTSAEIRQADQKIVRITTSIRPFVCISNANRGSNGHGSPAERAASAVLITGVHIQPQKPGSGPR